MELGTKDSEAARSFYGELFGWESETQDMGGTTHTSFKSGEGYTGGCVEMPAGEDVWPSWLVYLETDEVDSLVAKSDEMGGYITVPAQDAPDVGRFAILQDPQGAGFGVLKSAPTA
jgi:predicted enzyme related to lactoylglutathione lyase